MHFFKWNQNFRPITALTADFLTTLFILSLFLNQEPLLLFITVAICRVPNFNFSNRRFRLVWLKRPPILQSLCLCCLSLPYQVVTTPFFDFSSLSVEHLFIAVLLLRLELSMFTTENGQCTVLAPWPWGAAEPFGVVSSLFQLIDLPKCIPDWSVTVVIHLILSSLSFFPSVQTWSFSSWFIRASASPVTSFYFPQDAHLATTIKPTGTIFTTSWWFLIGIFIISLPIFAGLFSDFSYILSDISEPRKPEFLEWFGGACDRAVLSKSSSFRCWHD